MVAGMLVIHPLLDHVSRSWSGRVESESLVMATSMSVAMATWMRFRGHGLRPILEMTAVMYAGFLALFPFLWSGHLTESGLMSWGHVLMLLFMLAAMLARPGEYVTAHQHEKDLSERAPLPGPEVRLVPDPLRAAQAWPAALGLTAAVFQILTGVNADAVAMTVSLAASCYLAAAAFGRPWIAWVGILAGSSVITLSELAGFSRWFGLSAFVGFLVLVGLLRRSPGHTLTAQGLAMLGFGGAALAAVSLSPRLGLALAGAALASHTVWDYLHWRRSVVVARSMAEFCIVLDLLLGGTAIALAAAG